MSISLGRAAIAATERLLGGWDDAPYALESRDTSLVIRPRDPEGFAITLYDEGDQCMIAAQRWHTHYDDPNQAAHCAFWLLTPFYRLVEEFKGGLMVATWIERWEASGWEGFEPVYFLNPEYPPEWELGPEERYTRRLIQQRLLDSPRPYDQICPGAALDEHGMPACSALGVSVEMSREPIGPSLL